MKSMLASARLQGGPEWLDREVQLFEAAWDRSSGVSLRGYWDGLRSKLDHLAGGGLVLLSALIKVDLRYRFDRGEIPEVAEYLERFPELGSADSRVVSLIYEEYCLLEDSGKAPKVEDFCGRYPNWKDSLVSQLQYHRLFSNVAGFRSPTPEYPEVGENFEEFDLVALIGKGGSSRVFLARDLSLGGKQVVLKISADRGQEPQTQGALDHPHIVPVNSVAFQTDQGLRGLSMPYRPGMPLDDIIRCVNPQSRPRDARAIWTALVASTAGSPGSTPAGRAMLLRIGPSGDGWKGFPVHGSYSMGAAWITLVLARTLLYAHGEKTIHRDVKPGNILLTLHHGPQLLDFNLADSPHSARHTEPAVLGGTLPYMAPEQIDAFIDSKNWNKVDARSDLYSLGLVLRELLTGQPPDLPNDKLPLPRAMRELLDRRGCLDCDVRKFNRDIPHGLEAIVQRCLTPHPEDRYPNAQALADDLERFLARRPLLVAVNPSRRERWTNLLIANRRKLAAASAYAFLLIGLLWAIQFHPGVRRWLRPELIQRADFQLAERAIEEDRHGDAVKILRRLAELYPDELACNLELSLALANCNELVNDETLNSFHRALATPSAEARLKTFAADHPQLQQLLVNFAKERLIRLRYHEHMKNERLTLSTGERKPQTDASQKREYYEAMLRSLQLALVIGPDSEEIQSLIALPEEYLGLYPSAYDRLTRLINAARARNDDRDMENLVSWSTQRARVAIKWSAMLHEADGPAAHDRVAGLLRENLQSLDRCEGAILNFQYATEERLRNRYTNHINNYLWMLTDSWATLGQTEREAGNEPDAHRAFQRAKKGLDRLENFAKFKGIPMVEETEELRNRVRAGLASGSSKAVTVGSNDTQPGFSPR